MKNRLLTLIIILTVILVGCGSKVDAPETVKDEISQESGNVVLDKELQLLEKTYTDMSPGEQVNFTVLKLKVEEGALLSNQSEINYKRLLEEEKEYVESLPSEKGPQKKKDESITEEPSRKDKIEESIKKRFNDGDYKNVKLDRITINENLGTDEPDDYVALVYFIFDIRNKEETGNDLMQMYSSDLVATLAKEGITDISEIAIFWEDKHNNRNSKYAYEYKDTGFYISDKSE